MIVLPRIRAFARGGGFGMDEFFDLFEAVSALDDVSELADHADTLMDALEGLDYINLEPDDLAALDDLAAFGSDGFGSLTDWFDHNEMLVDPDIHTDSFSDANWVSFDDTALPDAREFGDVGQFVSGELADYPHHFFDRLDGIDYHPEPNPKFLGEWIPDGDSAHINLFDHQESIDGTLHHEMAHHLMALSPELFDEIGPHMAGSPMMGHLDDFLSAYSPAEQPEEFAAETFSFFKTKPELLQQLDPSLYKTIANWWQTHAAVA